MNQNLTEIACVLDRSGSMEAMKTEAIGGFNAFLEAQKNAPGEVRFTLILFDNEYLKVIDHLPLQNVPPMTEETFVPRGSTALLDAMGRTIDEIGARLAKTPEHERPCKVIIACMTDGFENASHLYSNEKVAKMIELQKNTYSWEFVFLAASMEAREMARTWSIQEEDIEAFDATPQGTIVANFKMSRKVMEKRSKRN